MEARGWSSCQTGSKRGCNSRLTAVPRLLRGVVYVVVLTVWGPITAPVLAETADLPTLFSLSSPTDSIDELDSGISIPIEVNNEAKGRDFSLELPAGVMFGKEIDVHDYEVDTVVGKINISSHFGDLVLTDLGGERVGDFIITWATDQLGSSAFIGQFQMRDGMSYRLAQRDGYRMAIFKYTTDLGAACVTPPANRNSPSNLQNLSTSSKNRPAPEVKLTTIQRRDPLTSDDQSFDLVVAYTDCALQDLQGVPALAAAVGNSVFNTNRAYFDSEIDLTLNLLALLPTDETEDCVVSSPGWEGRGNSITKIAQLGTPGDGKWDDVLRMRERYGADLLTLVVANSNGLNSEGDRPIAFGPHLSYPDEWLHHLSVLGSEYLAMNYLAHEIGHNLGAGHETGNYSGDEPGTFEYSHGYQWYNASTCRTSVMSYGTGCPAYPSPIWTRYFSNPLVFDNDDPRYPTGISNVADNAGTLNLTSVAVAGFRTRAALPSLAINGNFDVDLGYDTERYSTWDDSTAGNNRPDGWGQSGAWPGYIDREVLHESSPSVKLTRTYNPNDTHYRPYVYQDIPVVMGKTYTIEAFIKTACQDTNCFGTLVTECMADHQTHIWGDSCGLNNWIPGRYPTRVTGHSDWTKINFQVVSSRSDAKYLRVLCYNSAYQPSVPAGIGTVWCSDLRVKELIQDDDGGGHPEPEDQQNKKKILRSRQYGGEGD